MKLTCSLQLAVPLFLTEVALVLLIIQPDEEPALCLLVPSVVPISRSDHPPRRDGQRPSLANDWHLPQL